MRGRNCQYTQYYRSFHWYTGIIRANLQLAQVSFSIQHMDTAYRLGSHFQRDHEHSGNLPVPPYSNLRMRFNIRNCRCFNKPAS